MARLTAKTITPGRKYIPRDLSWVAFNERVLAEAEDKSVPLLERLRFLAIYASNLDEFFMVRVASLRRLIDAGYQKKNLFGYSPRDLMKQLLERITQNHRRVHALFRKKLQPEMEKLKERYKETALYDLNPDRMMKNLDYLLAGLKDRE